MWHNVEEAALAWLVSVLFAGMFPHRRRTICQLTRHRRLQVCPRNLLLHLPSVAFYNYFCGMATYSHKFGGVFGTPS